MQMAMVRVVTWIMIGAGLALLPVYGLWVLGGRFCDRRERMRQSIGRVPRTTACRNPP